MAVIKGSTEIVVPIEVFDWDSTERNLYIIAHNSGSVTICGDFQRVEIVQEIRTDRLGTRLDSTRFSNRGKRDLVRTLVSSDSDGMAVSVERDRDGLHLGHGPGMKAVIEREDFVVTTNGRQPRTLYKSPIVSTGDLREKKV